MAQHGMNYILRRGKSHHTSLQSNSVVHGHVQGTGLVKGVTSYKSLGAATRISDNILAGIHPSTKPKLLNGYNNHWHKGKGEASSTSKTLRRQRSSTSLKSNSVSSEYISNSVLGNGALEPGSGSLALSTEQMASQFCHATGKDGFKRKKIRSKKRDNKSTCPDKSTNQMTPQPEDWENEVQEIPNTGWNKMCFDFTPYDPEDVLHLSVSDLTLKETETDGANQATTSIYSPAIHHPLPIKWASYSIPSEAGQFAEADG